MNALVTGGGGFLGRYIVERLLDRGYAVKSLARGDYPELRELGVETIRAAVTDRDAVIAACENVDVVFHVAARVGMFGPWQEFYGVNVIGTRNIIDGCRTHGVNKLIFTSSPSVVSDGHDHAGINESHPMPERYNAYYPWTKGIAEQMVLAKNGVDGLLTCALRPHLIWGPRDNNLVPRMLDRAGKGKLKIVGNGQNIVDTCYVENGADAHMNAFDRLASGSPVAGSTYFITQGTPVNCWEFINRILVTLGAPPVTKKIPAKVAYVAGAMMEGAYRLIGKSDEPMMTRFLASELSTDHWFDISRAKNELGYDPKIDIDEGLRRLQASYEKTE
jgi:nucleoside-diphosphate-sugar epimerase